MKLLLIYGNMYTVGGIQTLLVRYAEQLGRAGHDVALLTRPPIPHEDNTDAMLDRFAASGAQVHIADGRWLKAPASLREVRLRTADVIVPCNLEALLLAASVQHHHMPAARVLVGVFAPREYCWRSSLFQRRWAQHLTARLLRDAPAENLMFATDGMARQTGECLGRALDSSPVQPLAIDTARLRPRRHREVDRRRVVSVQRLTYYYPHHRQMIKVIAELRGAGHDFEYHAYGDGEMRGELERCAASLGIADAIFFHGPVDYDRFPDVVADAFAYIGLGTGLIEAAACGIPSLVAIDSHPGPVTYGFIEDTSGNDIGGYVPGHPEHPIGEMLVELASTSEVGYREREQAARRRAEEFDIWWLTSRFVEIAEAARPHRFRVTRADRVLGAADGVRAAMMRLARVPDRMHERHTRPLPPAEGGPHRA
jgi:glycosyltransferase involved in cell wall biosynthesis